MRILFLCHRFPYPPNEGGKIRSFNMIRHLSRNHAVVVASLTRSEAERQAIASLERYCTAVVSAPIGPAAAWLKTLLALPTPRPSSFGYFASQALARRLRALWAAQSFDLVIAHSSSVGPYAAALTGVPKIIEALPNLPRLWAGGDQADPGRAPSRGGIRLCDLRDTGRTGKPGGHRTRGPGRLVS